MAQRLKYATQLDESIPPVASSLACLLVSATLLFKFDRSGRSEGVAWVTYGNEDHAAHAKQAFDGALAKGQFGTCVGHKSSNTLTHSQQVKRSQSSTIIVYTIKDHEVLPHKARFWLE